MTASYGYVLSLIEALKDEIVKAKPAQVILLNLVLAAHFR